MATQSAKATQELAAMVSDSSVAEQPATMDILPADPEAPGPADHGLEAECDLLRAMIDNVPDQLFIKDTSNRFLIANKAVAADKTLLATGEAATAAALIGKTDFDLFPQEVARGFMEIESAIMQSGQPVVDMLELNIDEAGRSKWVSMTKTPLRNADNEVIGLLGVGRDVTAHKLAEDQVHFLAHHDALTGLPNRVLLVDRLAQAVLHARRDHRWVNVVVADLDDFKMVNDSLGHEAGDLLLQTVAARMTRAVRDGDSVVRLGGDDFVILLADQSSDADVISTAIDKIRAAISAPILLAGQSLQVTCSMGIASFPPNGSDAETLLRNADAAMYQAKAAGGDNFQFFTPDMNVRVHKQLSLREEMRSGIANGEFYLLYQPQLDLRSGRVCAVEALVRWAHPTLGILSPADFVPLAEESGLIVPLGDWVLHEACRQNKAWQTSGIPAVDVCVNVSARQFRERNWIDRVKHALAESGLEPKFLELELTESLLMQDVEQAVATMTELRALGVRFAIDDFGTGYSSLSALKNFPVARLKIDQSFVRNLPQDADDRGIASAVISLGQKLNMRVIAEGVETDAQLVFLRDHQCDEIQGYHFSKPIDAAAIEDLLMGA